MFNYFKIHLLVQEKKSFKGFFLFLALATILFNGAVRFEQFGRQSPKEHSCEIISKSVHRFSRRSRLQLFFLFIALAAVLFSGAESFEQFW